MSLQSCSSPCIPPAYRSLTTRISSHTGLYHHAVPSIISCCLTMLYQVSHMRFTSCCIITLSVSLVRYLYSYLSSKFMQLISSHVIDSTCMFCTLTLVLYFKPYGISIKLDKKYCCFTFSMYCSFNLSHLYLITFMFITQVYALHFIQYCAPYLTSFQFEPISTIMCMYFNNPSTSHTTYLCHVSLVHSMKRKSHD